MPITRIKFTVINLMSASLFFGIGSTAFAEADQCRAYINALDEHVVRDDQAITFDNGGANVLLQFGGQNVATNYFNMDPRTLTLESKASQIALAYKNRIDFQNQVQRILNREPSGLQKLITKLQEHGRNFKRIISTLGSRRIEMDVFNRALAEQDLRIVTIDNAKNAAADLATSFRALGITEEHITHWATSGTRVLIVGEGAGKVFPELLRRGLEVTAADSWYDQDLSSVSEDLVKFQRRFQSRLVATDPLQLREIPINSYPIVISVSPPHESKADRDLRIAAAFRVTSTNGFTRILTTNPLNEVHVTNFKGSTYANLPSRVEIAKGAPSENQEIEPTSAIDEIPHEVLVQLKTFEALLAKPPK